MSDISGRLFEMPWACWDPDSSSWRTYAGTSHSGSRKFSGTWPTSGSMRDGACFEHPTWGHPISAPASSLLPTPAAQEPGGTAEDWLARQERRGSGRSIPGHLAFIDQLLPTPRTNEANGTGDHGTGDHGTGGPDLRTLVDQLLPTPTRTRTRSITANRAPGGSTNVNLGWGLEDVFWTGDPTDPPSNDGKPSTDPHQPPLPTGD